MADELKNKLYIIVAIVGLVITAAGGWTAVIVGRVDIADNKEANVKQDESIKRNTESASDIKTEFKVHRSEALAMQRAIETMQKQIDDGIDLANQRFIQILERLPKKE